MFLILNRLRGTIGAYAKVIGLLLGLIIATMVNHENAHYVAWAVAFGYIFGETIYGWGEDIGDETDNGIDDDGRSTERLIIRGFVWSAPTLIPLYFVGFSPSFILASVAFLSFSFPLAYKLGYYISKYFSASFNEDTKKYEIIFNGKIIKSFDEKFGLSFKGGWELGEGIVGLMQDIVFIGAILWTL